MFVLQFTSEGVYNPTMPRVIVVFCMLILDILDVI